MRDDCFSTQFVSSLHTNIREFVESRTPSTPEQAAQLADLYCETQSTKEVDSYRHKVFNNKKCGHSQELNSKIEKTDVNEVKVNTGDTPSSQSKLKCWTCGGEYKQNVCPQRNKNADKSKITAKEAILIRVVTLGNCLNVQMLLL